MNDLLDGAFRSWRLACFHDYCDKFPGVAWSLTTFCRKMTNLA